jgi:hypothetical protein
MLRHVQFSDLAVAGVRRLFSEDWRQSSLMQSISWALSTDAMRNATRYDEIGNGNLFLRGFFAGFELRVLFEIADVITVWNISEGRESDSSFTK